jgi:hypothetical protein
MTNKSTQMLFWNHMISFRNKVTTTYLLLMLHKHISSEKMLPNF